MRQGREMWLLVVALLVASMTAPAFAEVQNVKVGGDITVRGIWRNDLDLRSDNNFNAPLTGTQDSEKFVFSTVGVNLNADLTDNVSTDIRLLSQRDWGSNTDSSSGDSGLEVDIARAYVTLKELLYSPLTLRVGRQPLWFGKGFIVGSRLLAGDFGANGNYSAGEWTDQTGFDAVRATLDFDPVVLDLVYSKISEGTAGTNDDITLAGANAGIRFSELNAELETYYWYVYNQSGLATARLSNPGQQPQSGSDDMLAGKINTIGFRGSVEPIEHSSIWYELAYQWGEQNATSNSAQQGWGANLGSEFTLADVAWTPKLGLEWIFYSGAKKDAATGWNPIYRGKFDTLIREFQVAALYPTDTPTDTDATTNQHTIKLSTGFNPTDSIKVDTWVAWFFADEPIRTTGIAGDKNSTQNFFGTEWDTKATYDYTEDVQFGLIYGIFVPGSVFREVSGTETGVASGGRATAQELVSSVSVKF